MTEKLTLANGETYEGNFIDGVLQGKGKYTNRMGDIYEGDFVDGKFHGKGKFTMPDDHEYEGDFVANSPHGKGKWTSLRYDEYYEGDFFKGRKSGKGKMTYYDNRVYEGDFVDNYRTGKGKMTYPNGRIEEGEWKNGEFLGKQMNNEQTEQEILNQLNALIELDPNRDKNYYNRGLLYKDKKLWEKAEADFAKAFSLWKDPLFLSEWRQAAMERQALQTVEERMAPYEEIIKNKTEIIPSAEIIAAIALFEEYELLEALFETKQFTKEMLNETVSPSFSYYQPTPLYLITGKKALEKMKDPVKMIRTLASFGADPNVPAGDGSTMLWNQCNPGYPIEIMKTFLEIGADPNQTSEDGEFAWTPLAYCLIPGNPEDENGNPIADQYLPLESETLEKAKLLLDHNADPNLANPSVLDSPPLMFAVKYASRKNDETFLRPTDMELIKLLLEKGANPNFTDSKGDTPMIVALEKGMRETAELLLKYGAIMPNVKINEKENPQIKDTAALFENKEE